ncbi:MAG: aminotransferase class IV, partial [Gammaproteobacteria bacterium]|nr:aminotransferase class IV [Gammaproteobacteria bacterium]
FVVKDGVIVTPPLSRFLLPGVTREQVITLVKQNCMRCEERDLDKSELYDADEIWISSTTYTIRPIGKVDDQPIGNGQAGPVYQKVYQLFQQKIHTAGSTVTNHRKICDQ